MEKTVYESNVPRVYTLYRVSTIGQVEKDDVLIGFTQLNEK